MQRLKMKKSLQNWREENSDSHLCPDDFSANMAQEPLSGHFILDYDGN